MILYQKKYHDNEGICNGSYFVIGQIIVLILNIWSIVIGVQKCIEIVYISPLHFLVQFYELNWSRKNTLNDLYFNYIMLISNPYKMKNLIRDTQYDKF
jgi:hypothetical protein